MKNKILKTITWIMAVLFIASAAGLDSNTYIPHIVCAVALLWVGLFVFANMETLWGRR